MNDLGPAGGLQNATSEGDVNLSPLRRVFENEHIHAATRQVLEGALVFETAEPVLRFDAIIEREGEFVVPKSVGLFVAEA